MPDDRLSTVVVVGYDGPTITLLESHEQASTITRD